MRLASLSYHGSALIATPFDDVGTAFIDLNRGRRIQLTASGAGDAAARAAWELPPSLVDFLARGATARTAAEVVVEFAAGAEPELLRREGVLIPAAEADFLPVLPNAGKFLCVGRNYKEHIEESARPMPEVPVLFARFADSLVGHRQPMVRPVVSERLDWEGELAIVIGKHCRHVARSEALDVVAGYSIFNDGSVRDYQARGVQWTAGKNFWHTGPFGPYLVTADEVGDAQSLSLTTRINGEQVQHANTSSMLFDIATLIAHITEWLPLEPGDVIATGTPSGIGNARTPPRYLKPGDLVTVEIERLGTLENLVADEERPG